MSAPVTGSAVPTTWGAPPYRQQAFKTAATVAQRLEAAGAVLLAKLSLGARAWGDDWFGDEHIVDVHVGHLRKKLEDDAAAPIYIRTVRGIGYGMVT